MSWKRVAIYVAFYTLLGLIFCAFGLYLATLTGCSKITLAESPVNCHATSVSSLSQTWLLDDPGVEQGIYVVNMSDGEPEIAALQLNGAGPSYQLIVPVPQSNLPAAGIGVNTITTPTGFVQVSCPLILP